ncbi:hypothetical protein PENSPDRAFT_752909 [Peniophora sp. CONT]|nr:hypothetical protein PENSPDRAFT_752909 [Peniophora sp. CONT]
MPSHIQVTRLETALKDARSVSPAVILGSFLFGGFTLLLAFSAHILKHKGLRTRAYAVMLTLVILMYALAATSWAIIVSSLLRAVGDPQDYALQASSSLIIRDKTLQWCLGLNIFMSDIIVAWRTWSLWSDSRKARWLGVAACLLLLAIAAFGAADLGEYSLQTIIPDEQNAGALGYDNELSIVYANFCGDVGVVFSAVLNVSCVLLTAIKTRHLKRLQRTIGRRLSENRVGLILILLVSCEMAYCVFWVYWVVISFRNIGPDIPNLNLTLLICNNTAAVQVNGIFPTLVIVCVALQQTSNAGIYNVPSPVPHRAPSPFTFATSLISPPADVLMVPLERCQQSGLSSEISGEETA